MSAFKTVMTKSERILASFVEDADRFLSGVTPAEKALAVCVFGLVLMYFIMRNPKTYEEGGGMGRQFVFALIIVTILGFGVGWLFSGDIETLARSLPITL